jgi:hypothetical protein
MSIDDEMSELTAYQAGYATAKAQAAAIARLYQDELLLMGIDAWMVQSRQPVFNEELSHEGWRHGRASRAAENIADAIEAMSSENQGQTTT